MSAALRCDGDIDMVGDDGRAKLEGDAGEPPPGAFVGERDRERCGLADAAWDDRVLDVELPFDRSVRDRRFRAIVAQSQPAPMARKREGLFPLFGPQVSWQRCATCAYTFADLIFSRL